MTKARDSTPMPARTDPSLQLSEGWGWYLYGITRRGWNAPAADLTGGGNEPVRTLETGLVAAVVRPVRLSEFDEDVLQVHSSDPAWLEAIARTHNEVIATVHQERAVLPARFGAVYARADALLDALEHHQSALLDQLQRLDGCDEWAIHLYATPGIIQQRVTEDDPIIHQLRQDIAASTPGRAYLLERKLADELAAAGRRALYELGQEAYDRLARTALDGQMSPPPGPVAGSEGETEVLRAAFLVKRSEIASFLEDHQSFAARHEGLMATHSGPWPPYSFAVMGEEELR